MTVHELITILQQFNPDTEIQLANERWSAPIRGVWLGSRADEQPVYMIIGEWS